MNGRIKITSIFTLFVDAFIYAKSKILMAYSFRVHEGYILWKKFYWFLLFNSRLEFMDNPPTIYLDEEEIHYYARKMIIF